MCIFVPDSLILARQPSSDLVFHHQSVVMADKKMPNNTPGKIAMSRALGAAFLSHQVEQLEKTVSSNGPSSGNWRDRKAAVNTYTSPNGGKRGVNVNTNAQPTPAKAIQRRSPPKGRDTDRSATHQRRTSEESWIRDADVIVVDASVLIHALYQLKKWARDGRDEVVIVPLEALNTLDLLKKGTSAIAQKARAASRILEAQVGANPRIRVQRDDAFVLWDSVEFPEAPPGDASVPCPEWVRRIICCARWEVEHVSEELAAVPKPAKDPRVVLAYVGSAPISATPDVEAPLTPVPLPAPSAAHAGRYEQRAQGKLVADWATRAGVNCLQVDPALPGRGAGIEVEDERERERVVQKRGGHGGGQGGIGRGRRPSGSEPHMHGHGHGGRAGLVERPPAVMAMMEMVAQPSKVVRVLARGEKLDPDP